MAPYRTNPVVVEGKPLSENKYPDRQTVKLLEAVDSDRFNRLKVEMFGGNPENMTEQQTRDLIVWLEERMLTAEAQEALKEKQQPVVEGSEVAATELSAPDAQMLKNRFRPLISFRGSAAQMGGRIESRGRSGSDE